MYKDFSKLVIIELEDKNKPKLEDFYNKHDPRGCSTSEYDKYLKAVEEYERSRDN